VKNKYVILRQRGDMCLFTSPLRASVNKSHIPSLPQNNLYLIIIMNMCVVYWSEIHQLKYQRGFIFNGFRPNSQRWKYAILTNIFYRIRICSFFIHLAWRRYHSTAIKAWSFRIYVKKSRSYIRRVIQIQ
jgi:hypothetical protein